MTEPAPPPAAVVFECADCGHDIVPMYTTQADSHAPLAWIHVATRQPQCYPRKVARPTVDPAEAVAAATLPRDYWDRHDNWPVLPPMESGS